MQRRDALNRPIDNQGRLIYKDNSRVAYNEALNSKRKEVKHMTLIDQIKNFNINRMDPDEAIALSAQARQLEAEYAGYGAQLPVGLAEKITEVRDYVKASQKQFIQMRLREVQMQKQRLMPKEKKLEILENEEKELLAKLNA